MTKIFKSRIPERLSDRVERIMQQQVESIEIRCQHCKEWFNSPIFIGGDLAFITATLSNNLAQCPHCRKMTGCDKENMRVRYKDSKGGFIGDDT